MGGPGRKRIGLKKLHLDVFSFLSLLTNAESLCRLENKPSSAPDYMLPRSSGGGGASLYKRRPLPASASHEDRKEKKAAVKEKLLRCSIWESFVALCVRAAHLTAATTLWSWRTFWSHRHDCVVGSVRSRARCWRRLNLTDDATVNALPGRPHSSPDVRR